MDCSRLVSQLDGSSWPEGLGHVIRWFLIFVLLPCSYWISFDVLSNLFHFFGYCYYFEVIIQEIPC